MAARMPLTPLPSEPRMDPLHESELIPRPWRSWSGPGLDTLVMRVLFYVLAGYAVAHKVFGVAPEECPLPHVVEEKR